MFVLRDFFFKKKLSRGGGGQIKCFSLFGRVDKNNKNKIENRSAYFYFSENLFLTKFIAMIAKIIDISSISFVIICILYHISKNESKGRFFSVQIYHDLSFVTEFNLAS